MSKQIAERILQPNVGFLLKEAVGYRRQLEIGFDNPVKVEEMQLMQLQGVLDFTRTSEGLWVDGTVDVQLPVTCARCLTKFEQGFQVQLQELFYFPASRAPGQEDYVIEEDGILDLAKPIREQLVLGVPMQSICRPDCKGMCNTCGCDLNQGNCDCLDNEIDPRMAKLQALKDELSKDQTSD